MRILMIVDQIGPSAGGGERLAAGLAGALAQREHDVTFCLTRSADPAARGALEQMGVEVLSLGRRGALGLRAWRPLLRRLRHDDFDVLHAHKFGSNVWGVLFGRLFRVPVVIAHEQTWSYQGQIHRVVLDALIGRLSSVFVAVSSADRERMIKRERVPAERIVVVPNAYIPRADSPPGDLRAELGLSLETPVIGTVAQLRPQKALQVLLMAVADIRASHPGVRLVIAGDGECRQDLERLAKELGIADHTHFLGIREDICTVLGGFDVAALSSDFEGTPLFVVECMTHGTPLVATRVGGLPDLVEDGRSAILVPPRDPSALGAALNSLLSDQELRRRIGDQARERSQEFTLERIADRFESLYESLLARAAG